MFIGRRNTYFQVAVSTALGVRACVCVEGSSLLMYTASHRHSYGLNQLPYLELIRISIHSRLELLTDEHFWSVSPSGHSWDVFLAGTSDSPVWQGWPASTAGLSNVCTVMCAIGPSQSGCAVECR